MSKQTAVRWLEEQLNNKWLNEYLNPISIKSLIDQALQMEREQIEDAWKDGAYGGGQFTTTFDNEEQYYNETYGGNNE
jgi:hypothetical protein